MKTTHVSKHSSADAAAVLDLDLGLDLDPSAELGLHHGTAVGGVDSSVGTVGAPASDPRAYQACRRCRAHVADVTTAMQCQLEKERRRNAEAAVEAVAAATRHGDSSLAMAGDQIVLLQSELRGQLGDLEAKHKRQLAQLRQQEDAAHRRQVHAVASRAGHALAAAESAGRQECAMLRAELRAESRLGHKKLRAEHARQSAGRQEMLRAELRAELRTESRLGHKKLRAEHAREREWFRQVPIPFPPVPLPLAQPCPPHAAFPHPAPLSNCFRSTRHCGRSTGNNFA